MKKTRRTATMANPKTQPNTVASISAGVISEFSLFPFI